MVQIPTKQILTGLCVFSFFLSQSKAGNPQDSVYRLHIDSGTVHPQTGQRLMATGSAVGISPNLLLTAKHVVGNGTVHSISQNGEKKGTIAGKVLCVSKDYDLALVETEQKVNYVEIPGEGEEGLGRKVKLIGYGKDEFLDYFEASGQYTSISNAPNYWYLRVRGPAYRGDSGGGVFIGNKLYGISVSVNTQDPPYETNAVAVYTFRPWVAKAIQQCYPNQSRGGWPNNPNRQFVDPNRNRNPQPPKIPPGTPTPDPDPIDTRDSDENYQIWNTRLTEIITIIKNNQTDNTAVLAAINSLKDDLANVEIEIPPYPEQEPPNWDDLVARLKAELKFPSIDFPEIPAQETSYKVTILVTAPLPELVEVNTLAESLVGTRKDFVLVTLKPNEIDVADVPRLFIMPERKLIVGLSEVLQKLLNMGV